jgi:MFS-type transporter involved in bile tolerance (Atg22 family)
MDRLKPHPHVVNPKDLLKTEKTFSDKFAVWIATHVGSMYCFYLFNLLAFLSAKAAFATHNLVPIVNWVSSNWIQLVLLPAIMVAQNVAQKASDAKSEADHITLTYLANLQDEQMSELKNQSQILEFLKKAQKS